MAEATVPRDIEAVAALLELPEIEELIVDLEATRWTGRPGYPIRAMVGMCLVKAVYALPTWTRAVRLVAGHSRLQRLLGAGPSLDACYRFTKKVRRHNNMLQSCIDRIISAAAAENPAYGKTVAIDGSDLPAYANGQRFLSKGGKLREKFSDPDATWGHRSSISTRSGGGYYGYKVHAAVCTATGLPVAWQVETAKTSETKIAPALLNTVERRGFTAQYCVMDKGYDSQAMHAMCEARGIRPVIPLKRTSKAKAVPRECPHGTWVFAGADLKRGASKWRCPTGECSPASTWVKASRLQPLIPRSTDRFRKIYRQRVAVEREFGRLKHEWGMLPLRVRRLERVRLHVDLAVLARLGTALAAARASG